MSRLDAWFGGEYAAVRPYAVSITIPALLALDAVLLMIGHAGRYGADAFNVAHFAWLDALQPAVSPGLYIGVLLVVAMLGWILVLGDHSRWLVTALCVVYTYSWTMSMLDSYQHHYFLSWVLVCLIFLPATTPQAVAAGPRASARGLGYPLLCASTAILYCWSAIAKMDAAWLSGETLLRLSNMEESLKGLVAGAGVLGVSPARTWSLLAYSVVVVELVVAWGYVAAMIRDRRPNRIVGALCWGGWIAATGLHLGAEWIGLRIGWFSFYMLLLGSICLLPASWLVGLTAPARWLALWFRRFSLPGERGSSGSQVWALGLGLVAWMVLVSQWLDLPGSMGAVVVIAVGLMVVLSFRRDRASPDRLRMACICAAAVTLCWLGVALGNTRFDYYRRLGNDLEQQGRLQEALTAYESAERYAPAGRTRADRIERLERALSSGGNQGQT